MTKAEFKLFMLDSIENNLKACLQFAEVYNKYQDESDPGQSISDEFDQDGIVMNLNRTIGLVQIRKENDVSTDN